ncbi:hypothetical protein [uncultured Selenomonas sp.]|uniref:hypothetical protein n=1 Tax=uncultured Selenomonas sp. TaxID=159275 RepID=UPI0028DC0E85|nr:hypothetical protein [uncultured Selenomonas sp.]
MTKKQTNELLSLLLDSLEERLDTAEESLALIETNEHPIKKLGRALSQFFSVDDPLILTLLLADDNCEEIDKHVEEQLLRLCDRHRSLLIQFANEFENSNLIDERMKKIIKEEKHRLSIN